MTFQELKDYFSIKKLPKKMANEFMYFTDVQKTVNLHIFQIEREIERHGSKIKQSTIAGASKARLIEIKNILENDKNFFEW